MLKKKPEVTLADQKPTSDHNSRIVPPYGGNVVESRETLWGTLLIFQDFTNYAASLDATKEIQANTGRNFADIEEEVTRTSSLQQTSQLQESADQSRILESCVDWVKVKEKMNGNL